VDLGTQAGELGQQVAVAAGVDGVGEQMGAGAGEGQRHQRWFEVGIQAAGGEGGDGSQRLAGGAGVLGLHGEHVVLGAGGHAEPSQGGDQRSDIAAAYAAYACVAAGHRDRTGHSAGLLNHPDRVTEATRARVEQAITDLGFVRGGTVWEHAAHWPKRLCDLAVHPGDLWLVSEEGAAGGPPRTAARRAAARSR
jgi:hypothetical protein